MTDEEIMLRSKFYLAPATTSIESLRELNLKATAYPGLTQEQAKNILKSIEIFKQKLND